MNIYIYIYPWLRQLCSGENRTIFAKSNVATLSEPSVLLPRELNVAQLTAKLQIADEETRAGRGRRLM